ncbi:11-beta-hydroxysteroid dehydrogenase 1B-like [Prunus yedoensis var. nudiflora]|uniref:11-beta-hydroxysteroid dehydrogenase 1B-like n=1 Tax=Prunus yedoensis var. nudiflora TaxID=2094558 RepID=A0A314V0K1_PRUYE|nr:11-beta-hydroxysteroid dehydrogenase 1B-like [Prunus yedoensis var. nudiflora]
MDDVINKVLNIIIPPISLTFFLFLLPPYLFYKFLLSAVRSVFSEDVAGKVVLITGASSGIGEHMAYEYARRGACLALVARRENLLQSVASRAMSIGSPDVLVILQMFQRWKIVGALSMCSEPLWALSRGKIVGIASSAGWLRVPRLSLYGATKSAVISFYETLRVEIGREVGITIVTPGLVESEMTKGKFLSKEGQLVLDQELRDVEVSIMPILPVKEAAKSIVDSACRGENYLTVPAWVWHSFYWKVFFPELLEWSNRMLLMSKGSGGERDTISKKLLDLTGLKECLYPESVR